MTIKMNKAISKTYDFKTIVLHWLSAALIVILWFAGEFLDLFPKGSPRITVRSLHICLGLSLGLVLIYRVWWRNNGGERFDVSNPSRLVTLARFAHLVLYGVIATMVITGIALVWIRGDNLFSLISIPAFDPGNKALRHDAKEIHGWIANVLLVGACLHALMALWHQYVVKDGLMLRMVPPLTRKI